jgi:hypothetical protein
VKHEGGEESCIQGLGGEICEKDHLEDQGIDGRITLKWVFRRWDVGVWTGLNWLRIGTGGGHL